MAIIGNIPYFQTNPHHFRVISSKAGFSSTEIDSLEESLKARGKLQRAIGWWHRERERERKRESAAWMWVTDAVCEFNWLQHHFVIANQEMFGHYDKDGSGDIDSFEARKATLHWGTIHTHTHMLASVRQILRYHLHVFIGSLCSQIHWDRGLSIINVSGCFRWYCRPFVGATVVCRFRNCWMTSGWSSGPHGVMHFLRNRGDKLRVMLFLLGMWLGVMLGSLGDFSSRKPKAITLW